MAAKDAKKQLLDAVKQAGKRSGWKSSGGFFFRSAGDVFCAFTVFGDRDDVELMLRIKWRAFDEAFWAITGSPQLAAQPESFRARGAFVAPRVLVGEWRGVVDDVVAAADVAVADAVARSATLADHMRYLDDVRAAFLARKPHATFDLDVQRVLRAAVDDDAAAGLAVARARVDAGDSGGFGIGDDTFYERAVRHFEARR